MPPEKVWCASNNDISRLISDIIKKNKLKSCATIYNSESEDFKASPGTIIFPVDVIDGATSINLALKCAVNVENKHSTVPLMYDNEIYFFKTIYPTYTEFCESKDVEDGFRNVPTCYGIDETKGAEIVVLENLRKRGFTLFDTSKFMNDEHLTLVMRTFAKFHAISFAMKDQRGQVHEEFCERCPYFDEDILPKKICDATEDFLAKLDPVEDKDVLASCDNLVSKVYDLVKNVNRPTEHTILVKGDSWIKNMMFQYENNDREHPKDVMLIDWQCIIRGSPVHDVERLFYLVASEETVCNYKYYMHAYYEELSRGIKELGSDPEIVYSRHVFEKEWIDYGVYAFGRCLNAMKVMLGETEAAEEEYLARTKYIARHMIDIGILK